MNKPACLLLAFIFSFTSSGCARVPKMPPLGQLYDRPAMHYDLERNPVIVIPGILGSRLKDRNTGRLVWGAFGGGAANPKKPEDARLIALPMQEGKKLAELKDNVISDGALDRVKVRLFFLPFRLNAYYYILRILGIGGYRDEELGSSGSIEYGPGHYTCFQFHYDWRRDIVESARELHAFILEKRAYVQAQLERQFGVKQPDVRFDIVAHSMGGLVARYYLMYGTQDLPEDGSLPELTWEGARYVKRVIFVGTPSAGSVHSFLQLVEGFKTGPFLPKYPPAILGTMPAIYQLLPRARHERIVAAEGAGEAPLDIYDAKVWEELKWGLVNPEQDSVLKMLLPEIRDPEARRRIARDHLTKSLERARQFSEAMDVKAERPAGLDFFLFSGDAVSTASRIGVDKSTGALKIIEQSPGDGTVTRASALLDERVGDVWKRGLISPIHWSGITFLFADHLGMTKDPFFIDNLLFYLLEKPEEQAV